MAELTQQKPIIRITFDEMEAYMLLPEPEQGTGYTDAQIRQEMAARGITTGIDEQRISDMLEGHTYNAELLIAQGKKPVDGTDGYYEYKFDTNFDGKPKLLPDGSVDYWSVHSIESVTAGQVIAVYHPAVSGEDGMSVKGGLVPAKHGREQMPLKGKGFDRMDDEVTYTASMDGKIEMQNDRIVVLPVHEVSGNAELAEGNIDFRGDIVIHGNVESGVSIRATGSITIDGVAEAVIAVYHPAVSGEDGMSVKGGLVPAKHGREQMPLKGKGFDRMDDEVTYTASMDGKIEMQNDRIVVLPVHEVSGNAELAEGNIDFRGDIVIHGNVESGVSIRATGSITIDGVAEACMLEAGKDIILRGGMLGGNKASVKTKGAITAKFFEFTNILCEGDLQADVLMDCSVICHGQIRLTGRKGSIIGGKVQAIRGLIATSLGNDAEKRTEIFVGAGIDVYSRLRVMEKKIEMTREELAKIEEGLEKFEILSKERGVSYTNDPRRTSLLRIKIKDSAMLASDEEEVRKLRILAESSRGACVSVIQEIYPGVIINMDELKLALKNMATGVEFYKLPDKIGTRPCSAGVE